VSSWVAGKHQNFHRCYFLEVHQCSPPSNVGENPCVVDSVLIPRCAVTIFLGNGIFVLAAILSCQGGEKKHLIFPIYYIDPYKIYCWLYIDTVSHSQSPLVFWFYVYIYNIIHIYIYNTIHIQYTSIYHIVNSV
jgi:hypothetical protein